MNTINRLLINICSEKLVESKNFYTALFDFRIDYDSDWFVHLISNDKQLELGIIDKNNEIVPESSQKSPEGFYITFVVKDVDDVHKEAKEKNIEILENPTDTFYGQRRMLLKDPNGVVVDVSSPL